MRETILKLDANEGRTSIPLAQLLAGSDDEALRRYPDALPFEAALAARLGLRPEAVLATAGADDAIDRAARSLAGPGGALVSADPSFVEYAAAAARSGARYVPVAMELGGAYPLDGVLAALEAERRAGRKALAVAASPENPGGTALPFPALEALAGSGFPLLLDLTYAAFAQAGPGAGEAFPGSPSPGVIAAGSLSKTFGLAGLRIGWACGPAELVARLREAGPPFSLSSLAAAAGLAALGRGPEALGSYVAEVRRERPILEAALASMGARTWAGQSNFASAFVGDAAGLSAALRNTGILVRTWPGQAGKENLVRITCPGEGGELERLLDALAACAGLIGLGAPAGHAVAAGRVVAAEREALAPAGGAR